MTYMISNKIPTCKICGGPHYKTFCFQAERKPMATRKPLQATTRLDYSRMPIDRRKPIKPLKRSYMPSKSKNERSILVTKLDRVFSVYIRRKDAIHGRARCVTCSATAPWKEMQNGHFIPRRIVNLRWDEINCHVQCPRCNEDLHGNLEKYESYLINKYGQEVVDSLRLKSRQTEKIALYQIEEMITSYEAKLKELPDF